MNRSLGLVAALTVGFFIGSLLPVAGAHPESECPACVCPPPPPCPEDLDGDGIPDVMDVGQLQQHEEEAIQKALEAIRAVEKAEEEDARKGE